MNIGLINPLIAIQLIEANTLIAIQLKLVFDG